MSAVSAKPRTTQERVEQDWRVRAPVVDRVTACGPLAVPEPLPWSIDTDSIGWARDIDDPGHRPGRSAQAGHFGDVTAIDTAGANRARGIIDIE